MENLGFPSTMNLSPTLNHSPKESAKPPREGYMNRYRNESTARPGRDEKEHGEGWIHTKTGMEKVGKKKKKEKLA